MKKFLELLLILALILVMTNVSAIGEISDEQKLNAYYSMATASIQNGDYAKANQYIGTCLEMAGDGYAELRTDLYFKRGCIAQLNGEMDQAIADLNAALQLDSELADAELVLTQIYADQEQNAQAIEHLKRYLELKPEDTEMQETLGGLYTMEGDYEKGAAAFDAYFASGDISNADANYLRGVCRLGLNDYEGAIADMTMALESDNYRDAALYNRGVCQLQLGEFQAAEDDFTAVIDSETVIEGVYYNRGVCRMNVAPKLADEEIEPMYRSAIEDFIASAEESAYVSDSRYNEAICRMQIGEYDLARSLLETLKEDAMYGDAACHNEALCALQLGEYGDAKKGFEECIDKGFEIGSSRYYMGVCDAGLGDLEAALADYTQNIEEGLLESASYYNRGMLKIQMGDADGGEADLLQAMELGDGEESVSTEATE